MSRYSSAFPPPRETERVLMWSMQDADGSRRMYGALEDGTVFVRVAGNWNTLLVNPPDMDAAFSMILMASRSAEEQGSRLVAGPSEFGLDSNITNDIRGNDFHQWQKNEPMLLIAFDMATRTSNR